MTALGTPVIKDEITTTSKSVTLSWKAVSGAKGYAVYRYDSSKNRYVKVKYTSKTTWTDTGVKSGRKYLYKVKAYKKVDGKTVYSKASEAVSCRVLSVPSVSLSTNRKTGKTTIKWSKVKNATSYRVYTKETGGTWQLKKETTALSCTIKCKVYPEIFVSVKAVYSEDDTENTSEASKTSSLIQSKVKAKLEYLETVYAPGRYWNNGGVSDTPCNHDAGLRYCNKYLGAPTYFTVGGWSIQCNGFACMMSDAIFGKSAPISTLSSWDELQPGDMIRLYSSVHSLIVLTKTDTAITVAECNAIGGGCIIAWHREISRSKVEGQDHLYLTRYPDSKSDGTSAVGLVTGTSGICSKKGSGKNYGTFYQERICIINSSDPKYYYVSTKYGKKGYILKSSVTMLFEG